MYLPMCPFCRRSLRPHSSLPLLSSQLGLLQVEREGLESKLRQTQDTIAALQAQNNALRDKTTRANGEENINTWVLHIVNG